MRSNSSIMEQYTSLLFNLILFNSSFHLNACQVPKITFKNASAYMIKIKTKMSKQPKQTKLESFFTLADNNSEIHPISIVKPIIDDIISTVIKTKRVHTSCSKEKAKEWCASYPWLDILFEDEETKI